MKDRIVTLVPVAFLASPLPDEWLVFVTGSTSALAGLIVGIALEHRPPDHDSRRGADPTQG